MIVAALDWGAVGTTGAVVVSALAAGLTWQRGRKGDDALALSTRTAADNDLTKANVEVQGRIIDQLQEEVSSYRAELRSKHDELEIVREQMREMRHELGNAKAEVSAALIVIAGLERQVDSLQQLITKHEVTIERLELALASTPRKDQP